MDLFDRIMELSRHGYFCGQILAILLMETLGEENVGFVRAMGGLTAASAFPATFAAAAPAAPVSFPISPARVRTPAWTIRSISLPWVSLPVGLRKR